MFVITLEVPAGADPGAQATTRHFPDGASIVCVEHSPGLHKDVRVDELQAGDKLCAFGRPNPGGGSLITNVQEV